MTEFSPLSYRYAFAIYLSFAGYLGYFTHSLGLFLAQHVLPQSANGFSVANPSFATYNNIVTGAVTFAGFVFLIAHKRLKEYVVEVGDELTRVSWTPVIETRKSTLIVIVFVIVSSLFLFVADLVFIKTINAIMGTAA